MAQRQSRPSDIFPASLNFISLEDIAKETGWSERSLLDDCRAGRILHIHRKGHYSLTRDQYDTLIWNHVAGHGQSGNAADRDAAEADAVRLANAGPRRRRQAAA